MNRFSVKIDKSLIDNEKTNQYKEIGKIFQN